MSYADNSAQNEISQTFDSTSRNSSCDNSWPSGVEGSHDGDQDQWKRKKILNEIYETEKTYNHQLTLLTTIFLHPLNFSQILPPQIVDGLFSNVEAIHTVSTSLLKLMEDRGVVHALLDLAPYMKLYSIYANNFNTSSKLLDELLTKSNDFKRLLKFQEAREEMESQKLSALLLTPIQRVPRYRLLLENLLKKTKDDDPDVNKLRDAYDEIEKVTSHINECVRQHENFDKMLQIQEAFVGPNIPQIIAPGRYFIREGAVMKIPAKGKAKDRMLFLFNDVLICAKKETSCTFQCDVAYDLLTCYVEQLLGTSDNGTGLFKIITSEKKYLLLCSQLEKKSWVTDIKEAISKVHANHSSLRRGSFVMSAVSYENLRTRRPKTTTKRVGTGILDFNNNSHKSPIFNSISNRPSTKRGSIMVSPNTTVFDVCTGKPSGLKIFKGLSKSSEAVSESSSPNESSEADLINTSINSISSFVRKNSFLFESSTSVDQGAKPDLTIDLGKATGSTTGNLCDKQGADSDSKGQESPILSPPMDFTPRAEWTVTEKNGDVPNNKISHGKSTGELKILCLGNQVPSLNETTPYVRRSKPDVRCEDMPSGNLNPDEQESTDDGCDANSRVKKGVSNNSTTSNCILM